jgi:outer membrane protein with beta-barrel domain
MRWNAACWTLAESASMRQKMSRFGSLSVSLCVLFLFFDARPVRAEGFVTPFVGFSFGAHAAGCGNPATCEPRRSNLGISAGTSHGIFGFEEDISYIREFFGTQPGTRNAVLTITSNLMLQWPNGPIQPYGLVGLAFIRPHATLDVVGMQMDKNALGWDVGGGVNVHLQRHLGVRTDLRRMRTFRDMSLGVFSREQVEYWRGSVGLTLLF